VTRTALAAQFNVNRETVAACLRGPEFERLQQQLAQEIRETAVQRLKSHILPAANAWGDAIDVAAQKGDHRPAKDLLLHTKVIEPVARDEGSSTTILIGIKDSSVQVALSPVAESSSQLPGNSR
jgi:hypothetical protein